LQAAAVKAAAEAAGEEEKASHPKLSKPLASERGGLLWDCQWMFDVLCDLCVFDFMTQFDSIDCVQCV